MAQLNVLLTLFVVIFGMTQVDGAGGWSLMNTEHPTDSLAKAVDFAVEQKFPGCTAKLLSAMNQVVAGINFDFTAEMRNGPTCTTERFRVWDKFGTFKLTTHEHISDSCRSQS
jgi:hypothetical protein